VRPLRSNVLQQRRRVAGVKSRSDLRRHLLGQARVTTSIIGSLVTLSSLAGAVAGAAGIVPPKNPASDLWAVPAYTFTPANDQTYAEGSTLPACWMWGAAGSFVARGRVPQCSTAALAATDRAQHAEGLPSIVLPSNFSALSVPEQLMVLVDIERVSRGEAPVIGVSARANAFAQLAARRNTDPLLPTSGGVAGATDAWSANYAAGVNALDANYEWMYTDGWDGQRTFNYACTGPRAPGCWGHRDNILANASRMPCYLTSCSMVMGAGFVPNGAGDGYSSFTELFVQVSSVVPALYYTWSEALAAGARP